MLELLVPLLAGQVVRHVDLDPARAVLQRGEGHFAHRALEHHAAGDRGSHGGFFQRLLRFFPVRCIQLGSQIAPAEIVGVGAPRGAQRLQLLPALLDQPVVFFHFYTPCLRLAVTKSSRSPSSADCAYPVSTPGPGPLLSDWSST